ncbi:MAG: hypothetical protein ABIF10_04710 [Candidatus Woesearchaeota archaeon]
MDIEQTKKMNFMIRELTRTGSAKSYDDAMKMAGSVYSDGLPETQATTVLTQDFAAELENRMSREIGRVSERQAAEAKASVDFQESTAQEVKRLWNALEELKNAPKPEHKPVESTAPQTGQPSTMGLQPKEQKPIPHPRAGNYNSGDVALEKFFYFGK